MTNERKEERQERVVGFGVEDQWVTEALRGIIDMTRAGTMKDTWFYEGSPDFSTDEAEKLARVIDAGRIRVNILPWRALTYMDHKLVSEKGQTFFRIDMRCDIASVVMGIMGTDPIVYQTNNKHFVQMAKDIARRSEQIWPDLGCQAGVP